MNIVDALLPSREQTTRQPHRLYLLNITADISLRSSSVSVRLSVLEFDAPHRVADGDAEMVVRQKLDQRFALPNVGAI